MTPPDTEAARAAHVGGRVSQVTDHDHRMVTQPGSDSDDSDTAADSDSKPPRRARPPAGRRKRLSCDSDSMIITDENLIMIAWSHHCQWSESVVGPDTPGRRRL